MRRNDARQSDIIARMSTSLPIRTVAVLAVAAVLLSAAPRADALMHLRLVRAEPAADATVTEAPAEIRLFFSQEPVLAATSVRLLSADETALELGDPTLDEQDSTIVHVALHGDLAPGTYRVTWRTTSPDGHVVRGDHRFTYAPAEPVR